MVAEAERMSAERMLVDRARRSVRSDLGLSSVEEQRVRSVVDVNAYAGRVRKRLCAL